MAVSVDSATKYSLRYTVSSGNDSLSRTISGINVGGNSDQSPGPPRDNSINALLTTFSSFSNGTIGNVRWITERAVTW